VAKQEKRTNKSPRAGSFGNQIRSAYSNLFALIPMLLGVIGLAGLFQVYGGSRLTSLFSGNPVSDTLIGAATGMIAMGQALISYILGGEMLSQGVSLYAVTAFVLSWVTLGVVQLPLEAEMLGIRFTFWRNTLAFVFTITVSTAVVWMMGLIR